jgi:hypothetical protein
MNLIFGSGLIGYLAKKILGPNWKFVPFRPSRYYTFDIPLADNYICCDEYVDEFMEPILAKGVGKVILKRPFSCGGQLMYQAHPISLDPYLFKVYGDKVPTLARDLIRTTFMIYPITAKELHDALQRKYIGEINEAIKSSGEVVSIDFNNHEVKFKQGNVVVYDNVISTIPLDALYKLAGFSIEGLKAKMVCYYRIFTEKVDLEGAEQALVSDLDIDFFKVCRISKNDYVFWTLNVVDNPFAYFGLFLGYDLDIQDARRIDGVIPIDDPPNLGYLENMNVYCVGSNAQWDDFMDIASCIKRLLFLRSKVV